MTIVVLLALGALYVYGVNLSVLLIVAVLYVFLRIAALESHMQSQLSHLDWRIDQVEAELPDDEWDDNELDSEERQWEGHDALAADARGDPEKANCARCGQEHAVSDRYPGGICRNCWRAEMAVGSGA